MQRTDQRRIIMKTHVSLEAELGLQATIDLFGSTGVAVVSRTVQWMAEQPHAIQLAVLQRLDPDNKTIAKIYFRRIASEGT